jgi:tetratricopeptide (TPR) repeat protein
MQDDEKKIVTRVEKARKLYSEGKYPEAIRLYQKLAEILQEDRENLFIIQIELAWSYYNNGQYREAIDLLQSALKSGNLNTQQIFDCYRLIGFSSELAGMRKQAIKYLQQALNLDIPEDQKRFTYFELGKIYFTAGEMIEAEHFLKKAEPLLHDDEKSYITALHYYLGFTDYFQKNFDHARSHFDYVIENADDYKTRASGFFGLAHIHFHNREYPILIDLCEKIIRIDNSFFDKETLGYFLCESYLNLKDWDNLKIFFEELQSDYPEGRYASTYNKFEYAVKQRKIPSVIHK